MYLRIALLGAIALLVGSLYMRLKDEQVAHANTTTTYETRLRNIATEHSEALTKTFKQEQEKQTALTKLNESLADKLSNAETEVSTLKSNVDSGNVRLHVNVKPIQSNTSSDVSKEPTTRDLADDQTFELAEGSRSAYYSLTAGIKSTEVQIEGLQEYIRNVCLK